MHYKFIWISFSGFFQTLRQEEPGVSISIVTGVNYHPSEFRPDGGHQDNPSHEPDIKVRVFL